MTRIRCLAFGALAVVAVGLLPACGGSSSSTSSTPAAGTSASGGQPASATQAKWLVANDTNKSATLVLDAAKGSANSGYNFNGFAKGQMVVSVPTGWKITVRCKNDSTTLPHSCAIVNSAGSTTPAFLGSAIPNPTTGLAPGASATFTFTATAAGTYRIDCLVPGHDPLGMWNTLKVTTGGTPSISTSGSTSGGTGSY